MLGTMTGWPAEAQSDDRPALYKVGLTSRRLLLAMGDLMVGWLLQRQPEVALRALMRPDGTPDAASPDRAFYEGRISAARFFAREVLPRLSADRKVVELTTLDPMDLPEDAF
jgi:acetyl-CoA dehydrogenase-like protein